MTSPTLPKLWQWEAGAGPTHQPGGGGRLPTWKILRARVCVCVCWVVVVGVSWPQTPPPSLPPCVQVGPKDQRFGSYPDLTLEEFHRKHGLYVE